MKKIAAFFLAAALMGGILLPISVIAASDVYSSSALTYFSGGTYYWSYNTVSPKTVCDIETYTAVRDWSIPFPDNEMVSAGYFSTDKNLGVSFIGGNGGSTAVYPNAMCTIHFTKPMNFLSGMTYQFCLRINSFMLKDLNGNAIYFDEELQSVICQVGSNQSLYFSVKHGTTNYENEYLLTFKPTADTAVDALVFLFTTPPSENESDSGYYNTCSGSFTFSNMISYSGNGDYVSTNPQLDNISGQLDDIKLQLGDLESGLLTPPDLSEWEASQMVGAAALDEFGRYKFNTFPPIPTTNPGENYFIYQLWQVIDNVANIGIPFSTPALEWLCFGESDRVFRLYHFIAWYTTIFVTRAFIHAISGKVKEKNNPIQGDGDD